MNIERWIGSVCLCCTFSCFGPPYRRDCCNCFILSYIIVMNWWISGLVSLLTLQTNNLPPT